MADRCYAGVGPRETPADVLADIELAAERLALAGWTLRTGLSPGADQAFCRGALAAGGHVELYLPWPDFQAHARPPATDGVWIMQAPAQSAYTLAARFHPRWDRLAGEERKLRARDVHEVLGADLKSPAELIVCWTQDGSLDGTGPAVGATGQALRVGAEHGIAVLNLARPEHARRLAGLPASAS